MKISDIQTFPVGYTFGGGFPLVVKTMKKKWQLEDKWIRQCVLTDGTGDILADVNLGKGHLGRGNIIKIIVAEIQATDTGKKMYVDQYDVPTQTEPDEPFMTFLDNEQIKTIRSKILCWLTAAKFQSGATTHEALNFLEDPDLRKIVDRIMEG